MFLFVLYHGNSIKLIDILLLLQFTLFILKQRMEDVFEKAFIIIISRDGQTYVSRHLVSNHLYTLFIRFCLQEMLLLPSSMLLPTAEHITAQLHDAYADAYTSFQVTEYVNLKLEGYCQ